MKNKKRQLNLDTLIKMQIC